MTPIRFELKEMVDGYTQGNENGKESKVMETNGSRLLPFVSITLDSFPFSFPCISLV